MNNKSVSLSEILGMSAGSKENPSYINGSFKAVVSDCRDGDKVSMGKVELTFIRTPGHSEDSICVLANETGSLGKLVTGDTLFVGKVGGTGYGDDARQEYHS